MKIIIRTFLLLLLMTVSTADADERVLRVAVNVGPPWAFYDEDRGVIGIDVDIIDKITRRLGYRSDFHLLVYNRLIEDFRNKKFDIASPAAFSSEFGVLTSPYLPFEDVAVSLSDKGLSINSLSDLKGKSVVAYQSASTVLGEEFVAVVTEDHYLEIADREVQLTLLVNDKTDVVVGERRLLHHIMREHYPDQQLVEHRIFEAKPYGAILKDAALRDQFEAELTKMRESGELDEIFRQWH